MLAGALNAVAGGGSFLTFPALISAGVPPIAANATSAMAVSPGYLGITLGFGPELRQLPAARLRQEVAVAALGGLLGASLLLLTPGRLFEGLVPWLLAVATLLFAMAPWLSRLGTAPQGQTGGLSRWRLPGLLLVAVYGGYFNGWLGARWARRLPARAVRLGVIATGSVMSLVFFLRRKPGAGEMRLRTRAAGHRRRPDPGATVLRAPWLHSHRLRSAHRPPDKSASRLRASPRAGE